jgi:uncharacterized membrane protein
MSLMRLSAKVLIGLVLTAIAQAAYYFPRMPEVMSSHYGAHGQPNGWMTRPAAMVFTFAVLGIEMVAFGVLPYFLRSIPPSLINVPNKQYWLAPERKEQGLSLVIDSMHWLGVAVVLFFLTMMEQVYRANLHPGQGLDSALFAAAVIGFMGAVVVWIVWLYQRMAVPKDSVPIR